MGKDYYQILNIEKNSSDEEIKKAYRKLAVKWHPDKNPDNKDQAEKQFKLVSEAYAVLSDPKKKSVYDSYGSAGLEQQQNGMPSGFSSGIDPNIIFRNFFSSHDDMFSQDNIFGSAHNFNLHSNSRTRSKRQIKHTLSISLNDIYTGCTKKMKINRKKLINNTLIQETEILEMNIPPGMKDGSKFTFINKGDHINGIADDIIFEIKQVDHPLFERSNNDLILKKPIIISLVKSLVGFNLSIKGINNDIININLKEICPINPEYVHTIKNKGIFSKKNNVTGDLKVKFKIIFPDHLTDNQKNILDNTLPN